MSCLWCDQVIVHTSNKAGAGSDANVFIIMHGEKATSGKMVLKNGDKMNAFEKGSTDTFTLECKELGALKNLHVGHDNLVGGTYCLCVQNCINTDQEAAEAAWGMKYTMG